MTRYFYDCEFQEDGTTIALISIGVVADDGRELYLESADYDESLASPWLKEHVLPHLGPKESRVSRAEIREALRAFIREEPGVELVGYYSAYDHVLLAQIFGTMMDLPKHFPMLTLDLKQWAIQLGNPKLPPSPVLEHNALADAQWNAQAWKALDAYARGKGISANS